MTTVARKTRPIASAPKADEDWLRAAVIEASASPAPIQEAEGLIWFGDAVNLEGQLRQAPKLLWVQLPDAGIEQYLPMVRSDHRRIWTGAQGAYSQPCAEHALGLAIAGLRHLDAGARHQRWMGHAAKTLFDSRVTIVGAGGIAQALIRLMEPFRASITVVRRRSQETPGVATLPLERLLESLQDADLVVLTAALTPLTQGMIGARELRAMKRDAWLINVARGALIQTDDLVQALQQGWIGGAGLDVTDPEPLPHDHPLWQLENCMITSHSANPPALQRALYRMRIIENVRRFIRGAPLLGVIDPVSGY